MKKSTSIEEGARKAGFSKEEGARASAVVASATKADLVLQNETNQEPWWQSGVGFFGTGGVLWSLGVILRETGTNGLDLAAYDMDTTMTALGSLGMFGAVLYRRFKSGLKPMFSGWFQGD